MLQKVRHLVLIGEAAPLMEETLGKLVSCEHADNMAQAVQLASAAARPGDSVLLAPGCSSFDMFSGYAERGNIFAQAVQSLQPAGGAIHAAESWSCVR